jgi:hypothetical protein
MKVLDADHANAVIEHRQAIKFPLSLRAAELLANRLAAAKNPNTAADTMIERGWRGYDVEWEKGKRGGGQRDDGETRMGGMKIKFR